MDVADEDTYQSVILYESYSMGSVLTASDQLLKLKAKFTVYY